MPPTPLPAIAVFDSATARRQCCWQVPIETVIPVIDRGYSGDRGEFSTATPAAP